MRKLLILPILLALVSCKPKEVNQNEFNAPPVVVPMAVELGQRVFECDSTLNVRDEQISVLRDSLKRLSVVKRDNVDSLKTALFQANYKVEKCRYYVKICMRNKSQDKFLKGWIRRAVE